MDSPSNTANSTVSSNPSRNEAGASVNANRHLEELEWENQALRKAIASSGSTQFDKGRKLVLNQIAKNKPLKEILSSIVAYVEEQNDEMICSILLVDEENKCLRHGASISLPDSYNEAIEGIAIGPSVGSCGTAAYTGKRVVVEDIDKNFRWALHKQIASKAGLKSCWSEPILSAGGCVLGTFAIYHNHYQAPSQDDLITISLSADLAAIAIETNRNSNTLQKKENDLELLRALIDRSNDSIFVADPETALVLDCNEQACNRLQYSRDELLQMHVPEIEAFIPQHFSWEDHVEELRQVGNLVLEGKHQRKDGSTYPAEVNIKYVTQGNKNYILGIARDISSRKTLERNLEDARDKALEASRLKGEFLTVMSHEIRTPLNGVIGMANILLSTELKEQQLQMAEIIKTSGNNLLSILNDILDFSKIDAGKLAFNAAPFSLKKLVEESISLLHPSITKKGLELKVEIANEFDKEVEGDEKRIRQIVTNFLSNAFKFTESGYIQAKVISLKNATTPVVRFELTDTGIGISTEHLETLFKPFTQVDGSNTRKFEGTGLGLAICKQLTELMGGKIGVESELGKGSTFWFELVLPFVSTEIEGPSQRTNKEPSRILTLCKTPSDHSQFLESIDQCGYEAVVIENTDEAHAALAANNYQAIAICGQLPPAGYHEIIRGIREGRVLHVKKEIPIFKLVEANANGDPLGPFDTSNGIRPLSAYDHSVTQAALKSISN